MSAHGAPDDDLEVGQAAAPTAAALRWTTWAVVALASLGLVLPAPAGTAIAWLVVGLLIAVPVLRVLWLGARWLRRDDRRYGLTAFALAVTVIAGAVLATR